MLAREYFFIRIWAAPAVLMLFVFRGWFIGVQNTFASMRVMDVVINGSNIGLSIYLALYCTWVCGELPWGQWLLNTHRGLKRHCAPCCILPETGTFCTLKSIWRKDGWKRYFTLSGNLFCEINLHVTGLYRIPLFWLPNMGIHFWL